MNSLSSKTAYNSIQMSGLINKLCRFVYLF